MNDRAEAGNMTRQVGCEGDDGLLRIHDEDKTCDVCAEAGVTEREALSDDEIIAIRKNVTNMCLDYSKPYVDTLRFAREVIAVYKARASQPAAAVPSVDDFFKRNLMIAPAIPWEDDVVQVGHDPESGCVAYQCSVCLEYWVDAPAKHDPRCPRAATPKEPE